MSKHRPLTDGLKPQTPPIDPVVERQFVFAPKTVRDAAPPVEKAPTPPARASITTRIRADFATALKRVSLERQLNGTTPNTFQEVLEEALEPWMKANGFIS
jgi:hypothetical protein